MIGKLLSIPLVTTGGTIASSKRKDGALVAKGRDFESILAEDLAREGIVISNVYKPYKILSENTHFKHLLKLAKTLGDIIIKEQPKFIVVAHGTDRLEKNAKILNDEDCPEKDRLPPALRYFIKLLKALMKKFNTKIIFTGSNTDDPDEIKSNLLGAFRKGKQHSEGYLKKAWGFWVSFADKFMPILGAEKIPVDKLPHRYIGLPMQFQHSRDFLYDEQLNAYQLRGEEVIGNLAKAFKTNYQTLCERIQEEEQANRLRIYDVTDIRNHHNEFEESIDKNTRAVVLKLYHGSTANTLDRKSSVSRLVTRLKRKYPNLAFFAVTETGEPVDLTAYGTSVDLKKAGLISLGSMTDRTAFAKLCLLIDTCSDSEALIKEMLIDRANELKEPSSERHEQLNEALAV